MRTLASLLLCVLTSAAAACRTSGEPDKTAEPVPPVKLTEAESSASPILKKSIGELTGKYPENRLERCIILEKDVADLKEVKAAIETIKTQELADAFIFRAQIPSIQYFAFSNGEPLIISETGDEKMTFRRPAVAEVGNPALDTLMAVFNAKCGGN